jgi:hypothetical protein
LLGLLIGAASGFVVGCAGAFVAIFSTPNWFHGGGAEVRAAIVFFSCLLGGTLIGGIVGAVTVRNNRPGNSAPLKQDSPPDDRSASWERNP